jgi:hypothetical protein
MNKSIWQYEKELMGKSEISLFQLHDPKIRNEFMNFMNYSRSSFAIIILNLIYAFLYLPFLLMEFFYPTNQKNWNSQFTMIEIILAVALFLAGWYLYYIVRQGEVLKKSLHSPSERRIDQTRAFLFLSLIVLNGTILIHRSISGQDDSFINQKSENLDCKVSQCLPFDAAFNLITIPVVFTTVLRETRIYLTMAGIGLILCFLFTAVRLSGSFQTAVFSVVPFMLFSIIIIFDLFKQHLFIFLLCEKLKTTLETNERLCIGKASEMRKLVSNAAHDLKTVI